MTGGHDTDMPVTHKAIADRYKLPNQTAGKEWLSERELTPHHAQGTSVQIVPTKLHGGVRHTGGASGLRNGKC